MAKPGKGVPTTGSERWKHLQEQMDFLRRSCRDFDEGHLSEAKRMANEVVKLVFNERNFHSVLQQVGLMPGMGFISTAMIGTISPHKLVHLKISAGIVEYAAPLDRSPAQDPQVRPRVLMFPAWWNESVISLKDRSDITRRQLVRTLRDELGGGHVDPEVDPTMAELHRSDPVGTTWECDGVDQGKIPDIELHTMRQIAYEVLISIERKLAIG